MHAIIKIVKFNFTTINYILLRKPEGSLKERMCGVKEIMIEEAGDYVEVG